MSHRNVPHSVYRWLAVAAWCSAAAVPPAAKACGPFFPNQLLVNGDEGVLSMPAGEFTAEVATLLPTTRPANEPLFRAIPHDHDGQYQSPYDQSYDCDLADLTAALTAAGVPADRRSAIINPYRSLRGQLSAHLRALSDPQSPAPGPPYPNVPDGLPAEFADYVRGLIAYDTQDWLTARRIWTDLLARPADQRHWRSTWAAFMIGKSYIGTDAAQASQAFAQTRQLAAAGFADSLGLASSSFGWEARSELSAKHFAPDCALYLRQLQTGDPTAAMSLRETASAAFANGPESLTAIARDGNARQVITAYLLANGGWLHSLNDREKNLAPAWFAAVKSVGATDMPGADRLAWAAYRVGDFDAAAHWAARAPADAPVAGWVRAKLLLRAGKVDAAGDVLATLVNAMPADVMEVGPAFVTDDVRAPDHVGRSITGDLAVLRLTRGQYTESLDLLLRTRHWLDAAYIAERVLTVDELRAFVDRRFPKGPTTRPNEGEEEYAHPVLAKIEVFDLRCLLARRLARLDRWSDARPYFPPALQDFADAYTAGLRDGHDEKRPAADRAASLVTAARLARTQGMELLGTELDPDYHVFEGQFEFDKADHPRSEKDTLTRPAADEVARWKGSALANPHRWHYRYVAADIAWSAAALMPDGSDATAALLYEAGCWLKDRDAKSAERFYKSMTKRCPKTDLGKRAAALHWFPKTPK